MLFGNRGWIGWTSKGCVMDGRRACPPLVVEYSIEQPEAGRTLFLSPRLRHRIRMRWRPLDVLPEDLALRSPSSPPGMSSSTARAP
jgi:hypothetical protein